MLICDIKNGVAVDNAFSKYADALGVTYDEYSSLDSGIKSEIESAIFFIILLIFKENIKPKKEESSFWSDQKDAKLGIICLLIGIAFGYIISLIIN